MLLRIYQLAVAELADQVSRKTFEDPMLEGRKVQLIAAGICGRARAKINNGIPEPYDRSWLLVARCVS
jgi:hypothetical protein